MPENAAAVSRRGFSTVGASPSNLSPRPYPSPTVTRPSHADQIDDAGPLSERLAAPATGPSRAVCRVYGGRHTKLVARPTLDRRLPLEHVSRLRWRTPACSMGLHDPNVPTSPRSCAAPPSGRTAQDHPWCGRRRASDVTEWHVPPTLVTVTPAAWSPSPTHEESGRCRIDRTAWSGMAERMLV